MHKNATKPWARDNGHESIDIHVLRNNIFRVVLRRCTASRDCNIVIKQMPSKGHRNCPARDTCISGTRLAGLARLALSARLHCLVHQRLQDSRLQLGFLENVTRRVICSRGFLSVSRGSSSRARGSSIRRRGSSWLRFIDPRARDVVPIVVQRQPLHEPRVVLDIAPAASAIWTRGMRRAIAAPLPGVRAIGGRPLPDVPARAWGNPLHVVVVTTWTARDTRVVAPQVRVLPIHQGMWSALVPPAPVAPEQPPANGVLAIDLSAGGVVAAGAWILAEARGSAPVPRSRDSDSEGRWSCWRRWSWRQRSCWRGWVAARGISNQVVARNIRNKRRVSPTRDEASTEVLTDASQRGAHPQEIARARRAREKDDESRD